MIIVTTVMTDGIERVEGLSIVPQDLGPKGNLPGNTYSFDSSKIPTGFYLNYKDYCIIDGQLHLATASPAT